MKIKQAAAAAIFLTAVICSLPAEELKLNDILSSALLYDETMQVLLKEAEIQFLQNSIDDYKMGFSLSAGAEESGTSLSNIGQTDGPLLNVIPFAELSLPETTGTSIKASAPVTYNIEKQTTEASAALSLNQDLCKLFGIEKEDSAKDLRRASLDTQLRNRIESRRAAVEKEILEIISSLASLEKSIITNTTSLDEKESLLTNMLKAGMIARNGSSHLSKLMEIRSLETETEELRIDYKSKLEHFYRLTGVLINEAPQLPPITVPKLPDGAEFKELLAVESDITLKEAELSDFNTVPPPKLSLNIGGSQSLKTDKKPELNAGFSSGFEDFDFSLNAKWNNSEGGTVSAGISLNLDDKTKKELTRQIYGKNLETSKLNLEIAAKNINRTIRELQTSINKLESSERNLNASNDFITKYLDEMRAKFQNGLIPEIELIKAQDQKKSIDIDMEILNIDRYLLSNSIRSLVQEE